MLGWALNLGFAGGAAPVCGGDFIDIGGDSAGSVDLCKSSTSIIGAAIIGCMIVSDGNSDLTKKSGNWTDRTCV